MHSTLLMKIDCSVTEQFFIQDPSEQMSAFTDLSQAEIYPCALYKQRGHQCLADKTHND